MESLAVLSRTRLLFGCLSLLSGCKSRQREADQITCVRLTPEAVTHRLNIDCESNSGAMRLTPSSFSSLVLVAPTRKLACPTAPTRRTSSRPAKTDSRSLRSPGRRVCTSVWPADDCQHQESVSRCFTPVHAVDGWGMKGWGMNGWGRE